MGTLDVVRMIDEGRAAALPDTSMVPGTPLLVALVGSHAYGTARTRQIDWRDVFGPQWRSRGAGV